MVAFSGKERKLGEQALSGITSNLKNTITGMKAIMGKKFHSDPIQQEFQWVGYTMVDVAGKVGIPVSYNDEDVMLTPERAMAMLMKCLQAIAELDQGSPVTDVVVSVPSYFTDAERHSMLDAAKIAGLNCLRLMNDCTAAALSYGIYKTDMPTDKETNVAFVDCGAMDTTVTIVSFVKGKLTVKATACDRHFGGRDFDMILAKHFAAEWKEKHKIDALTNKKAMYRLLTAAEKTKKVLSANPSAPINIECFMDDIDVKGMMDRSEMLEVAEPFLARLDGIMAEALQLSGLTQAEITSCEVYGGTCRIPAVQDRVAKFFQKEHVSKTLNFDECVAKGCALQCAMLSPAFKVRDFSVNDVTLYPIALTWSSSKDASEAMEVDVEGESSAKPADGSSTVVFGKFNSVPNTKMLTFYRKDTFSLTASYDPAAKLPNGFPTRVAEFTVADIPPRPPPGADGKVDPTKIKVKLRLDIHGCLIVESAVAIEEQEVIEEVAAAATDTPPADSAAAAGDAAAEGEAANPESAAPGAADGAEEQPAAGEPTEAASTTGEPPKMETKKTKKVKRVALSVATKGIGITPTELMEAQEAEGQMALLDKIIQQTAESMNALEAAVYRLRDESSTKLAAYLTEADREKLSAMCTQTEDWLYEDGMDVDKATYEAKLKELQAAFAPGVLRENEAEERPEAFAELEKTIEKFSAFAASQSEDYEHIDTEQKQKVAAECATAQAWLADSQAKISAAPKTEPAPLKPADIRAKAQELSGVCQPIMSTPKPLPIEPEKPAADAPAAESPADAAPAAEDGAASAGEAPKPDNMDVD